MNKITVISTTVAAAVLSGLIGFAPIAAADTDPQVGDPTSTASSSSPDTLNLALRFDPNSYALAGIPQRLVVSVMNNRGEPPASMPSTLAPREASW